MIVFCTQKEDKTVHLTLSAVVNDITQLHSYQLLCLVDYVRQEQKRRRVNDAAELGGQNCVDDQNVVYSQNPRTVEPR